MITVYNQPVRPPIAQKRFTPYVLNGGRCVLVVGDVFQTFSWVSSVFKVGRHIQVA